MIRLLRPIHAAGIGLALVLAACASEATPSATPPEETITPGPSATVGATAADGESPSDAASPSPGTAGDPSGFTVGQNPEADALFLERDDCQNLEDGYQLQFPEAWFTNTAIDDVPACSWFSPDDFEVGAAGAVPAEVAITVEHVEGDPGSFEDAISRQSLIVGATQDAVRVEYEDAYLYRVQLGPTPEEGPNLLVRTTTEMGGDFALNKAVLDRIMATIEFIGTIE